MRHSMLLLVVWTDYPEGRDGESMRKVIPHGGIADGQTGGSAFDRMLGTLHFKPFPRGPAARGSTAERRRRCND